MSIIRARVLLLHLACGIALGSRICHGSQENAPFGSTRHASIMSIIRARVLLLHLACGIALGSRICHGSPFGSTRHASIMSIIRARVLLLHLACGITLGTGANRVQTCFFLWGLAECEAFQRAKVSTCFHDRTSGSKTRPFGM